MKLRGVDLPAATEGFVVVPLAAGPEFASRDLAPGRRRAARLRCAACVAAASLIGCGGGSSSSPSSPPMPPPTTQSPEALVRVSSVSPFGPGCDGTGQIAGLYVNAEVEPSLAVNPRDTNNLIGVWQQDRWSGGSARGILTGVSFDGGVTWQQQAMSFSRCAGGTPANGGDFARVSDPWVTIAPDGIAHQNALASTGGVFEPGSTNAVLVSRSTDSGRTWTDPAALITDGESFFNDKNSITADPTDARLVYATWDRLPQRGDAGPAYLARSVDHGVGWEAARPIYDAGPSGQTINNQIVVLPDGTLVDFFVQLDTALNGTVTASMGVVRSADKGSTWSQRIKIADVTSVGTRDPEVGTRVRDGTNLGSIAVSPQGALNVVWQDARATNGARDNILHSRSTDGGLTWSAPARINADPSVPAFTPTVAVRADGMIGVTYYDLRSNTADVRTLLADYWLTRSTDGVTWRESRVAGPFDLALAPNANGLFLGDYQSLVSIGSEFVPFFAQSGSGDTSNRSDVYAFLARNAPAGAEPEVPAERQATSAASAVSEYQAEVAPAIPTKRDFKRAVHDNIVRMMERRVPGWSRRGAPRTPAPD